MKKIEAQEYKNYINLVGGSELSTEEYKLAIKKLYNSYENWLISIRTTREKLPQIEYKKWLNSLSTKDRIMYFADLAFFPSHTKLQEFGGFMSEIRDYRYDVTRKGTLSEEKRPSHYDIDVKEFKLENCVTEVTDQYSTMSKKQLKALPQYKLLPSFIKKNKLSKEFLTMALVTKHIMNYRTQVQFYTGYDFVNRTIKTIAKGTKFYHGSFAPLPETKRRKTFVGQTWVTQDKHNAFMYASQGNSDGCRLYDKDRGVMTLRDDYDWTMYVFEAKRDLNMLDVSRNSLSMIKKDYPYMEAVIATIFPTIDEQSIGRNSIIEYDYLFSMFVCEILELDGYTASGFKTFQAEEMICNMKSTMNDPVIYRWSGKTVNGWLNDSRFVGWTKEKDGSLQENEKIVLAQFYQNFVSFEQ